MKVGQRILISTSSPEHLSYITPESISQVPCWFTTLITTVNLTSASVTPLVRCASMPALISGRRNSSEISRNDKTCSYFSKSFGHSFKNITEKVGLLVENPTFPVYLKSYCLSEACTQSKDQLATFVVHRCFRKINVIECIEIRLVHIIL